MKRLKSNRLKSAGMQNSKDLEGKRGKKTEETENVRRCKQGPGN